MLGGEEPKLSLYEQSISIPLGISMIMMVNVV
jgi:hypothetical protein